MRKVLVVPGDVEGQLFPHLLHVSWHEDLADAFGLHRAGEALRNCDAAVPADSRTRCKGPFVAQLRAWTIAQWFSETTSNMEERMEGGHRSGVKMRAPHAVRALQPAQVPGYLLHRVTEENTMWPRMGGGGNVGSFIWSCTEMVMTC